MLKMKMISIAAIAGMVLALTPAVNADPITVLNPGFEGPDISAGPGFSNLNVTSWDVDAEAGGADALSIEARDGTSRPLGDPYNQSVMFDMRGSVGEVAISQVLGTITSLSLAGVPSLDFSFDLRLGGVNGEGDGEDPNGYVNAFWIVDGVIQSGGQYSSTLDGGRDIRTNAEILLDTGGFWDRRTVNLDLSGVDASHSLAIGFAVHDEDAAGCCGTRVHFDNVTVDSVAPVPEPGTMSLLAISGLGVLMMLRRRRS